MTDGPAGQTREGHVSTIPIEIIVFVFYVLFIVEVAAP